MNTKKKPNTIYWNRRAKIIQKAVRALGYKNASALLTDIKQGFERKEHIVLQIGNRGVELYPPKIETP